MPRKKKKKREISISPLHLKRRKESLLEDTTGVERLAVFKVSRRIGRILSSLIIVVGLLLLVFSLGFLDIGMFFTDQMKKLTIGFMGFLGVLNTLCGLLLLTKE